MTICSRKLSVLAVLLLSLGVLFGATVTGCTDKDREDNGKKPVAGGFDFIRILPPGYEVTGDGQIVDEQGETVDIDDVDPEVTITEPGEYEFTVVGVDENEDGTKDYADITEDEDLGLELETSNEEAITLDGATLIVGEDVQEGDTATITGVYGDTQLTADIDITIGEEPAAEYSAIVILPPGYTVEDGQIKNADGETVDADEVETEFSVSEPGEYQFTVVGVTEDEEGNKTCTDITGDEDLALALETSNEEAITLDGAALTVGEDVQEGDTATITGTYGETQLTADIQISVGEEPAADYKAIRILPPGYAVEDGVIKDSEGKKTAIDDIDTSFTVTEPGEYQFTVVGIGEDEEGNDTYTDITGESDLALTLETSNEEAIVLDGAKLTVSDAVNNGDTAKVSGTYGSASLEAEIDVTVSSEPAVYKEIRILPPGYTVSGGAVKDGDGKEVAIDDITGNSYSIEVEFGQYYEFIPVGIAEDGTVYDISNDADFEFEMQGAPYESGDGTVGFTVDSSNHGIVSVAVAEEAKTSGTCYLVGHYPGETEETSLSCDVNFTITLP